MTLAARRPTGRGRLSLATDLSRQRCKLHPVGLGLSTCDALLAKESVGTIHSRADLDHDDEDAAGPIQTQVFLAL